jgi:transcriptional regulator with XRE-family HTH domain
MNKEHLSNQQILETLGNRFMTARLNQNMSRVTLAEKTGLTEKTISNLEKGHKSVGLLNIIAILRALNMLDEIDNFIPEPPPRAESVVGRDKALGKTRQRASSKRKQKPEHTDKNWTWGNE